MLKLRLYYAVKPLLPWSFRIIMRRLMARQIAKRSGSVWPINPATATPPPQWPGWPEGKRFAVALTHDVEGPSGLARCAELAAAEAALGFRSSFNFIPEGTYRVTAQLREQLTRDGFEVGVHDLHHDGSLYKNRESFRDSAARINGYLKEWNAVGFRSGFMYHRLDWIEDLDAAYDASTFDTDPFEPQPDAANTIFPFWVPRANGGGYVELPYTLPQDSTLYIILQEKSCAIWKRKLDWVAAHGGMALVNVHPDYLSIRGASGSPSVMDNYLELLRYIKETHAGAYWHVLPRELAAFVRQRQPETSLTPLLP